jgi:hypothetical protein
MGTTVADYRRFARNNGLEVIVVTGKEIPMTAKFLVVLGALGLLGCVVAPEARGPVQYESSAIDRDASERVRVNLSMGAGDLKVSSGTQKLIQAYFNYNVPDLKPNLHYSTAGGIGDLRVEQPSHRTHLGNMKYEWDLRMTDQVPLEFHVNFGAGQAQLDLGSLDLRSVQIDMGVGQLEMDLRGNPKHDYNVRVNGGVGEATVRLPANIGIDARASGGIGDISVRGLRKEGGHWVNDAYNQPGVKIRLDVEGGIGSIRLIAE